MSGYVVFHLDKSAGNESAMTDHIERNVIAPNVDSTRTHLNKELIEFPEGVTNRTEAIQHRIKNAGLSRKVGKNQVQVIRAILSGSTEDMLRIQAEGKLDEWCKDSIDYLKKEFGDENIVAATLHLDEDAPHIHASIVPIVEGERRKKKSNKEQEAPKKQYRKKSANRPRLCADDVMAKTKLIHYQDSYAEAMAKYGLQRGVRGSEARHIPMTEHFRNQKIESDNLQINIGVLLAMEDAKRLSVERLRKEEDVASEKISDMYDRRDEAKEKFLAMDKHVIQREKDLTEVESKLQNAQKSYEPYKGQEELAQVHGLFPMMKEQLRIANLCEKVGLGFEYVRMLFDGKNLTAKSFSFFSPEHNLKFEATDIKLKVEKEVDNPNKLQLSINGVDILDWFREKYKKLLESQKTKISEPSKNKRIRR